MPRLSLDCSECGGKDSVMKNQDGVYVCMNCGEVFFEEDEKKNLEFMDARIELLKAYFDVPYRS